MKKILQRLAKHMISFSWSKELSVGNAILDSEHKNIISEINNIMRLIEARDSTALSDAFEMLENWLIIHFENEELFAQTVNFDFSQHKLAHQHLLNELQCLKNELVAKNAAWSDSGVNLYHLFFHNWLIEHITNEDMQMKPLLQSYPHDFVPTELLPAKAGELAPSGAAAKIVNRTCLSAHE